MTEPLVPANVDLCDFAFMPFEFDRLFKSDTWLLSNDAEKVAAITLWGKSWSQVPAGSLPSDDRLLAQLSGAGTRWKRIKPVALRGWREGTDGRLYHPVVCEKALEAWLEKLAHRLSSGAGNAKRWGIEFDPAAIEAEVTQARQLLAALNPQSRLLTKRRPPGVPPASRRDDVESPAVVPSGSQGTGTGTENLKALLPNISASMKISEAAGMLVRALAEVGYPDCSSSHPDLIAAASEGITAAELRTIALAKPGKPVGYLVQAARGKRADAAERAAATATPAASGPAPEVIEAARLAHERDDKIITARNDCDHGLITPEERDRRIAAARGPVPPRHPTSEHQAAHA